MVGKTLIDSSHVLSQEEKIIKYIMHRHTRFILSSAAGLLTIISFLRCEEAELKFFHLIRKSITVFSLLADCNYFWALLFLAFCASGQQFGG